MKIGPKEAARRALREQSARVAPAAPVKVEIPDDAYRALKELAARRKRQRAYQARRRAKLKGKANV